MVGLARFLKDRKATSSDSATHHCMAGMNGGSFTIIEEAHSEFYRLYLEALESGQDLYLSEKARGSRYIHYFIDLDYSYDTVLPNFQEVLSHIIEEVAYPENYIVSRRNPFKYHINFPECIITPSDAKLLSTRISERLQKNIPLRTVNGSDVPWLRKVIDLSVYNTGLRMPGSKKPPPKKDGATEIQRYMKLLPEFEKHHVTPPFGLNPCQSDLGTFYKFPDPISLDLLELTTIRYNIKNDDTLPHNLMMIDPEEGEIDPKTALVDLKHDDKLGGGKVLDQELQEAIKPFITEHFKHQPSHIGKMSEKEKDGKKVIYIQLKEKWCPIIKAEHKGNNQFIVIAESDYDKLYMEQLCYDGITDPTSKCRGQNILPQKVPEKLEQILYKLYPHRDNGALKIPDQVNQVVQHLLPGIQDPISRFEQKIGELPCGCRMCLSATYPKPTLICRDCTGAHAKVMLCAHGLGARCEECDSKYPVEGCISIPEKRFPEVRNFFILFLQIGQINIICHESPDPLDFFKDNLVIFEDDAELNYAMIDALGGTHVAIANLLFLLKKDLYRVEYCSSNSSKEEVEWYHFNGIVWKPSDRSLITILRKREFIGNFMKAIEFYENRGSADPKEDRKRIAAIHKVIENIRSSPFQRHVMFQCASIFFEHYPDFTDKINCQNVFAFANCVYDFDEMVARRGRPEDCVTIQSKYEYIPYDEDNPRIQEVLKFFESILPDPEVREYAMKCLSTCLTKDVSQQKFFFWTGVGANGKSLLLKVLGVFLGGYFASPNSAFLYSKRESAQDSNEALANLHTKRLVVFNEIPAEEKIKSDILKSLCGGDPISTRKIRGHIFDFFPQFKCFLVCNTIPMLTENTHAEWRRIRVVHFPMKFVDKPDPSDPFEAKKDYNLESKLLELGSEFLSVLVHYYGKYVREGLVEPKGVLEHTARYQDENDKLKLFVQENLERHEAGYLQSNQLYENFTQWWATTYAGERERPLGKRSFMQKIVTDYLKIPPTTVRVKREHQNDTLGDRIQGWAGWRLRNNFTLA